MHSVNARMPSGYLVHFKARCTKCFPKLILGLVDVELQHVCGSSLGHHQGLRGSCFDKNPSVGRGDSSGLGIHECQKLVFVKFRVV